MSSEEYRLALCERCRVQLRLCGRCDRGQRLCSACRPVRRRESLHRASAAYRVKPRARRLQSVRQARYRDRFRGNFVEKKVTHHTVTQAASSPTSSPAPEITTGRRDRGGDRPAVSRGKVAHRHHRRPARHPPHDGAARPAANGRRSEDRRPTAIDGRPVRPLHRRATREVVLVKNSSLRVLAAGMRLRPQPTAPTVRILR